MDKRKAAVVIASIAMILVVALLFVDKLIINRAHRNGRDTQASIETEAGMKNEDNSAGEGTGKSTDEGALSDGVREADDTSSSEAYNTESLIRDELIKVDSNTPEYDMELRLYERADKKTHLGLRYYLNGASVINNIGDVQIPELKEIFESRDNAAGNKQSYTIKQALLNPVYSQLYVMIYGSAVDKYTQASLYEININDGSVKKLMSYPGEYGKIALNRDKSLMAYSFEVPPQMSQYQESFLIDIYDCEKSKFIIKSSRDASNKLMGGSNCPGYSYNYEFTSWQAPRTARLKQTVRSEKDSDSVLLQGDVLYDVDRNLIMNMDGSIQEFSAELKGETAQQAGTTQQNDGSQQSETAQHENGTQQSEAASGTGGTQNSDKSSKGTDNTKETGNTVKGTDSTAIRGESEQVKLLRSFYSYLKSEEDYKKAMDLLDNDFVFRMGLLKQFGVEYIVKSDFDAEDASMYSQLLKAAKFDTIAVEDLEDGIYTISYYHYLGLDSESQLRQLMVARMKKSNGMWKIISIEEGKE